MNIGWPWHDAQRADLWPVVRFTFKWVRLTYFKSMNKNLLCGSCHLDGEIPEGVDQESVVVSGGHLLTLVEISFSDALDESVIGLAVYLESRRGHQKQHGNGKSRVGKLGR